MDAAVAQLESALSLARSLADAARATKATPGDTASQERLRQVLDGLKQPGLLLHAPAGIGMVSPEAVSLSSGSESVSAVAAHNVDLSAGQNITATAEDGISLLAHSADMQLKAAKGNIDLHALEGLLHALAKGDIKIESVDGRVHIRAEKELILECGGVFVRLKDGDLDQGAPGNIYQRAKHVQKLGSARLDTPATPLPGGYSAKYVLKDEAQAPLAYTRYRITTEQGEVFNGVTDKEGRTMSAHTLLPGGLKIEFPNEASESGQGHWVTIDHDYHALKNTALMAINRLTSLGDEGRLVGSEGKDYMNTKRDKIQEWTPLGDDVEQYLKTQSVHRAYGERRQTTQTFLEGDDSWAVGGSSWHWQPVITDKVYEKKEGVK